MKRHDKKWFGLTGIIIGIIFISFFVIHNLFAVVGLVSYANVGCCLSTCQVTSQQDCPRDFNMGRDCSDIGSCNIGCCVDKEGYCYDNYIKHKCTGEFIASNCENVLPCVTQRKSLLGFTGFPVIYEENDFLYAEPFASEKGTPVLIKALLFEHNVSVLNVSIVSEISEEYNSSIYNSSIYLFDDGQHGDNNPSDGTFAGTWENNIEVTGIRQFNILWAGHTNHFFVSSHPCLPTLPLKDANESLIILTKETGASASKALSLTSGISQALSDGAFNVYAYNGLNPLEEVAEACSLLFEQNVDIIYLNPESVYCQQQGNIIEINPTFIFNQNKSLQNPTALELLHNFCAYTTTQAQMQDEFDAKHSSPTIEIMEFIDPGLEDPYVNLTFVLHDNKEASLNYTLYYDVEHLITTLVQDSTLPEIPITISMKIPDGQHSLWLLARDQDKNFAASNPMYVEKDVTGFQVFINSLDAVGYETSPTVEFSISHRGDSNISYILRANDQVLAQGSTPADTLVSIPTELELGEHTIYVIAEDENGERIVSLPYYIVVGSGDIPLYPAVEES